MSGTPESPGSPGPPADEPGATFVRPVEQRIEEVNAVAADLGPDLPPLRPGELLAGRFSIDRFIARGGMGTV